MSYLGIDVGTTGCKVIAFDKHGHILARAYQEYPLIIPSPGWAELDAENIWQSVKSCIVEVAKHINDDPPISVAVSTLGEATIPISPDGSALSNGIVSFDTRSISQYKQFIECANADEIYAITGLNTLPHYSLFKWMWWIENRPALYQNAWKLLCFGDFIGFKLGIKPTIDYSMATRTLAFDVRQTSWSSKILNIANVDVEKLPEIAPSGTIMGELPDAVARNLELPLGTKLVLGGLDQACAALGAGVIQSGATLLSIGTVGVIGPVFHAATPQMCQNGILSMPHVIPGEMITFGATVGGGSILRWYRDILGYEEREISINTGRDIYDVLLEQIDDKPTHLIMLPHLSGSRFAFDNPNAKGVLIGLTFSTSKADLIRAILEGVSYELAIIRERFENVGLSISSLRAVGGGSRSDIWMQIIADSLQLPIYAMQIYDAAPLGVALLSATALGNYKSIDDATEQAVIVRRTFSPRPGWSSYHNNHLATYRNVYKQLESLYPMFQ